jgi:hypothetical protein
MSACMRGEQLFLMLSQARLETLQRIVARRVGARCAGIEMDAEALPDVQR